MNRRGLLLSSLGLAVVPLDTVFGHGKAPQKWALLIGIDAYLSVTDRPVPSYRTEIILALMRSRQKYSSLFRDPENCGIGVHNGLIGTLQEAARAE